MTDRDEIADAIANLTLFADLTTPQLQGVAHAFEEVLFPEGERILRQGLTGSGFYIILEGDAAVLVDGEQRATLLLGEPPSADVVALRPLRCIVLAGPSVEGFMTSNPRVSFRMLQSMARRLRNANRYRNQ